MTGKELGEQPAFPASFGLTGGLTKRELFAILIYAVDPETNREDAIRAAETLLRDLAGEQAAP